MIIILKITACVAAAIVVCGLVLAFELFQTMLAEEQADDKD